MNILTCIKKVTNNDTKRKYTEKNKIHPFRIGYNEDACLKLTMSSTVVFLRISGKPKKLKRIFSLLNDFPRLSNECRKAFKSS